MENDTRARLQRLQEYHQGDPGNAQLLLDIGHLHLQLREFHEALSAYQQAKSLTGEPIIDFHIATAQMAMQQYDSASNLLEGLLDSGIDGAGVRYNLGYCYLFLGDTAKSVLHLEAIPEEKMAIAPDTRKILARSQHFEGQLDTAANNLEQHIQQQPDDNEALGMLALLEIDRENKAQALKLAEQCLTAKPDSVDALLTKGLLSSMDFDLNDAIQYFDRAIKHAPEAGRAWLGKGLASMNQGQVEQAEQYLHKAVELLPAQLGCWNTLAWSQLVQNKLENAEETIKKAIGIDRTFGDSYGTLATIQLLRGNTEEAEHNLKLGQKLDPDSFACSYAETIKLQTEGKVLEAQQNFRNMFNRPLDKEDSDQMTLAEGMRKLASKMNTVKH